MFVKRMACDLAWNYALYAEFFKKKGTQSQVKEKLRKTIELMQGCKADGWIKKCEEKLARRDEPLGSER